MTNDNKFEFGKNWRVFLEKHFSDEALHSSKSRLSEFLGERTLKGKTFVDLGSGSGIHSLAALELGALHVTSIDVDKESVECALRLRESSPYLDIWRIQQASLLDESTLSTLGQFDVVYCWGVAHHTGDMHMALTNISKLVKKGGVLFLAIYNYVEGRTGSRMWWSIKNFYNRAPSFLKKMMEYLYISTSFITLILHLKNPFFVIRSYKKKRGMAWTTDLVDWLGGFPYEYASTNEIFNIYRDMGYELINIKTTNYIGCNQFLFLKK